MKKINKFFGAIIAIVMMLGVSLSTLAHDFEVDGIYYNIISDKDKSVEITYNSSNSDQYIGSVTIPSSVSYNGVTYSATSIGNYAFDGCTGLISVTIPNTVTSIGFSAFSNCSKLISVTIGNSVTSIGSTAFRCCYKLTDVTIPNSVTSIGEAAFNYCTSLTSVTIPNSVTSIGEAAFYGCSKLTKVTISNSVTSIEKYVFYGCSGLASVTIPNSVTSIGAEAFESCDGLTSVTIPNSVTSIGDMAFYDCTGLTSVIIGNSVSSIGDMAFNYCTSLTSIVVESENTTYDSRDNCNAIIETTSNTLIQGCKNSTLPNSLTSIGDKAFYSCDGLTSVTIPNSVTSIGDEAFYDCDDLTSVTIPYSVMSIGWQAFCGCSSLTSVFYNAINCSSKNNAYLESGKIAVINKEVINIPNNLNNSGKLGDILISQPITPPTCGENSFTSDTKIYTTLYVPKGCCATYWSAPVWQDFKNIKEIEYTAESLTLPESIDLTLNTSTQLAATFAPSNTTITKLFWVSSDPSIATIDQEGNVTAVANGKVTITAYTIDGSKLSASCEVIITQLVTSIALDKTVISSVEGSAETITATVLPENASNKVVSWSTSDETIATVTDNNDGTAVVTFMKVGVATITATTTDGSNLSASCEVSGLSGIIGINANGLVEEARYDIYGRMLAQPTKGINIIKMSDGSIRKEWVKE